MAGEREKWKSLSRCIADRTDEEWTKDHRLANEKEREMFAKQERAENKQRGDRNVDVAEKREAVGPRKGTS